MKYYKTLLDLPGHKKNDILIQTNDFYMWETEPYYTFPIEIIENSKDFFEQVVSDFNEGQDIWYISLNGLIIADKFKLSKHSSLVDYGNIFKDEQLAININNKIKNY